MQKLSIFILSLLLIAASVFGCSTQDARTGTETAEGATQQGTSSEFQTPETSVTEDVVIASEATAPESPEADPVTPDPTPAPTPESTPEPNPFAGVWTVADLPFILELREDGTYRAAASADEREGTYTFQPDRVLLSLDAEETLELQYDSQSDAFVSEAFQLVRGSNTELAELDTVPVTYVNENDDLGVSVRGAVVEATAKKDALISQYCFTKSGLSPAEGTKDWFDASDSGEPTDTLRVFKYDGNYTLWTRDADGNPFSPIEVTVRSGFLYPIRAEGVTSVRTAVDSLLTEKGASVEMLNGFISRDIAAAGVYSRTGAVTAGVSLISNMAQYGYSVVYQGHGSYQGEKDWGINPEWGAKLRKPTTDGNGTYYYTGMQCVASIVWAYKQAGLNLSSQVGSKIGTLGERTRSGDNKIAYDRAESGDIVQSGGHYLMVIDRLDQDNDGADDAYLTYEMWSPHLTMLILTFRQVRGRTFYSMDALFDGSGRNASKANFWKNTFRIPSDALPDYLREAIDAETDEHNYEMILKAFGLSPVR